MKASLIGAEAELQARRRVIPIRREPLQLLPCGGLKAVAIVQQNAAQQLPGRRPRLKRRVQAAKIALASTTRTSRHNKRPPPHAQPESDRTEQKSGGQSRESGFGVGEVTVHSAIALFFLQLID